MNKTSASLSLDYLYVWGAGSWEGGHHVEWEGAPRCGLQGKAEGSAVHAPWGGTGRLWGILGCCGTYWDTWVHTGTCECILGCCERILGHLGAYWGAVSAYWDAVGAYWDAVGAYWDM